MPWKVTMLFDIGKRGYSESHYDLASTDQADVRNAAVLLADARLKICGANVILTRVRVSEVGSRKRYRQVDLASIGGEGGKVKASSRNNLTDNAANAADVANTCLILDLVGAAGSLGKIYAAGIPDAIINTFGGGVDVNAIPTWWNHYVAFTDVLRGSPWGFRVRDVAGPGFDAIPVDGVIQQDAPPSLIGLNVTDPPANWQVGTLVQTRGFTNVTPGLRTINGEWVIGARVDAAAPSTHTLFLRGSGLYSADRVAKLGTVENVIFKYEDYADVLLNRDGSRKRGVGFAPPRGRRKAPLPLG